jgi:hypothetical protein
VVAGSILLHHIDISQYYFSNRRRAIRGVESRYFPS